MILSLLYSVYTAASIFLLQIQASDEFNTQVARRLHYCVAALERAKEQAPILKQALELLLKELSKLELKTFPNTGRGTKATVQEEASSSSYRPNQVEYPPEQDDFPNGPSFQTSPSGTSHHGLPEFDFSDVQVDPSIFEAFSALEPISVQVGALEENW